MAKDFTSTRIGGVNIHGGSVNTGGGDIVGRDKIQTSFSTHLETVFAPVVEAVKAADPGQKVAAMSDLKALRQELEKGHKAKDSVVATLIDRIVGFVPSAVNAIIVAFANPLLSGITGPLAKSVLDKLVPN